MSHRCARLAAAAALLTLAALAPVALGHEVVRLDVVSPKQGTTVPAGPVDVQISATPLVALVGATSFTLTIDDRPVERDGGLGDTGGVGLPFLVRPEEPVVVTVHPAPGSHVLEMRYLPDFDVGEVVVQVRFEVEGGAAGGTAARVALAILGAAVVTGAVLFVNRRRHSPPPRDTPHGTAREGDTHGPLGR